MTWQNVLLTFLRCHKTSSRSWTGSVASWTFDAQPSCQEHLHCLCTKRHLEPFHLAQLPFSLFLRFYTTMCFTGRVGNAMEKEYSESTVTKLSEKSNFRCKLREPAYHHRPRPTPQQRVLEKLIVGQLVKKFPAFYRTQWPITNFTKAHQWTLTWDRQIQSTSSNLISLRPILLLSSHLCLGVQVASYLQISQQNICMDISSSPMCATCSTHLTL
jgi:hypothetical protein